MTRAMLLAFLLPFLSVYAYEFEDTCVHCSEYVLSTAAYKERVIMGKVMGTEYGDDNLPPWKGVCDFVNGIPSTDLNNVFDRFSDERPAAFDRVVHFSGIIASVKFIATGKHNFTGIFQGADHGVLRFSPVAPLLGDSYLVNHFIGTFPFSFAVKFFRHGRHSGNINTGESVKASRKFAAERQFYDLPDFNIFTRFLDNMSGVFNTFDPLFGEYEKHSGVISPVDAATYDQNGKEASIINAPVITQFHPNPTFAEKFGRGDLEFRRWATKEDAIAPGDLLYTMKTTVMKSNQKPSLCVDEDGIPQVDDDVATYCPQMEVIELGKVYTTSRFYAAQWPDDKLFFQHHRMCPKDQSVCKFDSDPNTPLPTDPNGMGLGNPDTTYALTNNEFCLSSDDKSGKVMSTPPSCPFGSNRVSTDCYAGTKRNVEKVQRKTCPMMDKLNVDILTAAPGSDTELPACDFGYNALNVFLTVVLSATSPILRGVTETFPATKDFIDNLISGFAPN